MRFEIRRVGFCTCLRGLDPETNIKIVVDADEGVYLEKPGEEGEEPLVLSIDEWVLSPEKNQSGNATILARHFIAVCKSAGTAKSLVVSTSAAAPNRLKIATTGGQRAEWSFVLDAPVPAPKPKTKRQPVNRTRLVVEQPAPATAPEPSSTSPAAPDPTKAMMTQYFQLKTRDPEAILLFRQGDCYVLYHDDALTGSALLCLPNPNPRDVFPSTWFPAGQLEAMLKTLLGFKRRAAVCEMVTDSVDVKSTPVERIVTTASSVDETVVGWTTAPEAYDGFGTETLTLDAGRDVGRGLPVRKVLIRKKHFDWQTQRYGSGMHPFVTEAEARKFSAIWDIYEFKTPESEQPSTPDATPPPEPSQEATTSEPPVEPASPPASKSARQAKPKKPAVRFNFSI
jgi:hypothetical protein